MIFAYFFCAQFPGKSHAKKRNERKARDEFQSQVSVALELDRCVPPCTSVFGCTTPAAAHKLVNPFYLNGFHTVILALP